MKSTKKFIPPDGGYGWVVVMASFLNLMIVAAHFISFSLLYPAITVSLKAEYGISGWIGSVNQAMVFLPGFIYSTIVTKYGGRMTSMAGSVLVFVGYVSSAFSVNISMLYFTYGIVAGVGLGLVFLPSLVTVHGYFDKNRGLASGVTFMGFSIGGIVTSIPMQYCIMTYGWRGAMLIYGAISLHVFAFGQLLRTAPKTDSPDDIPKASYPEIDEAIPIINNGGKSKSSYSTLTNDNIPTKTQEKSVFKDVLDFSLFKNCDFVLYGIAAFCFNVGLLTFDMHLISRALTFGIPRNLVPFLSVAEGVGGIVSRLVFSYVANLPCTDRTLVYGIGIFIYSIVEMLAAFGMTFVTLCVACVFGGLAQGAIFTVQNTVLVDVFGLHRIAKSQAMLNVFTGAACFITTPFAGFLYDKTQNYNIPYTVAGTISVLGALAVLVILIRRDRNRTGTYLYIDQEG